MRISDATLNAFSYYRERGKYYRENRYTKERQEVPKKSFEESLAISRALIDEHRGDFEAARRESEQIAQGRAI